MKNRVIFPAAAVGLLSCLVVYVTLNSDVAAQERPRVSGPVVQQIASVKKVEKNTSAFSRAATQNATLRNSLSWAFGKTQTGWNIYVPLISHTIGTDAGPDSAEFALALSEWQGDQGMTPTGVLDEALRVSGMCRQATTERHLDVGRAAAEARSRRESAKRHRRPI